MKSKSILSEIVDTIDMQSEDFLGFVSKTTEEAILISREHLSVLEDGKDYTNYPDWEKESIDAASVIYKSNDYISLPSQFDVYEYQVMENFCYSLSSKKLQQVMLNSIKGSGAFRRFKDHVNYHDIAESWYEYKQNSLEEIACAWCLANDVPLK